MAYDETVAERVREVFKRRRGVTERKMFGGIAFMLHGNMCCGVVGERLMLRLGNELAAAALDETHTHVMDFTGKPIKSMIYVEPAGFRTDGELSQWIDRAASFVKTLPAK